MTDKQNEVLIEALLETIERLRLDLSLSQYDNRTLREENANLKAQVERGADK